MQNTLYWETFLTLFKPSPQVFLCFLICSCKISTLSAEAALQVIPSRIIHGCRGLQQAIQRIDVLIHGSKCHRVVLHQFTQLIPYGGDGQQPLKNDVIVDVGSPVTVFAFQVISHAGIEIPHRTQMQHILISVLVPVKARRGGFAVQYKFIYQIVLQKRVHVDVPGQCIQRDRLIGRCRHIRHQCGESIVKVLDSLLQQCGIVLCHRFFYHEVLACAVVLDPNIFGGIKRLILLHKNALGIVQI